MSSQDALSERLAAAGKRLTGETHRLGDVRRLTGGANMESWWIDYGPHEWVMRRLPEGIKEEPEDGAETLATRTGIPLELEARIVTLANAHGVTAPCVVGDLKPSDALGTGYIMQRIAGESMPHKILGKPGYEGAISHLAKQCARELAAIHAIPIREVPAEVPALLTVDAIDTLEARYRSYGAPIPVFELAFGWLKRNMPSAARKALLHGDFRMGNLLVDSNGITSVLDWELAHIGDPAQDIAYLCTPSWRFGHYDKTAGGFGQLETLLAHYNRISGRDIPAKDIQFWLVFAVLTWGLATLKMITVWRTGQDRSLERAVIGRRTSETEVDLLLIIEDLLGAEAPKQPWSLTDEPFHKGDTNGPELAEALIEWTQEDIMPNAQGRDLFQARVARNALRGVLRELQYGPAFARSSKQRFAALGMTAETLHQTLRRCALGPDILTLLRLDILERLTIDQPTYAGLGKAMQKWTHSAP